jgi:hypothetical protein
MAIKTLSYGCFDELIVALRADGLTRKADKLHYLLHNVAWTTGSELVGELGQELKQIEHDSSKIRSELTGEKIEQCFEMVLFVWPDFPR